MSEAVIYFEIFCYFITYEFPWRLWKDTITLSELHMWLGIWLERAFNNHLFVVCRVVCVPSLVLMAYTTYQYTKFRLFLPRTLYQFRCLFITTD